jgi:hypothetical protein
MPHETSPGQPIRNARNGAMMNLKKIIATAICLTMISLVVLILLPILMGFRFN